MDHPGEVLVDYFSCYVLIRDGDLDQSWLRSVLRMLGIGSEVVQQGFGLWSRVVPKSFRHFTGNSHRRFFEGQLSLMAFFHHGLDGRKKYGY